MNTTPPRNTASKKSNGDLSLAFDVGHSSIGWGVLQDSGSAASPTLLGCGAVIFPADDCLASQRRGFRRQRRHIRSTRQRIARMKLLLAHLDVLTKQQLDRPGCAWPWKLAARVLRGAELLSWAELWDVLRWYAHNRGYDGNRRWSSAAAEGDADFDEAALEKILKDASATQDEKDDAEKVKAAKKFMRDLHTNTMAETFCAICGIDPLGKKKSANLPADKRPKGQNAAYPRGVVEGEVRKILHAHFGKLKGVDANLEKVLFSDWRAIPCPDLKLPRRYQGGLLFGQLVPRFDNRIISQCQITGEKVPTRHCAEFLNFRWAMTLANIRIGFVGEKYTDGAKLRPLLPAERRSIDTRVRRLGFLKYEPDKPDARTGLMKPGKNELREIVIFETKCHRHNIDELLLHPDAKESLKLLPVKGDTAALRVALSCFDDPKHDERSGLYHDDPLRHRFARQLLRHKSLTLNEVVRQLERIQKAEVASRIREAARAEVADRRGRVDEEKLVKLLTVSFHGEKLKGRARFSRKKLTEAFQQVFQKDHPIHPLEKGGCLEQTDEIQQAAIQKAMAKQTNNHLVRHRLLILTGNQHLPNDAKRKRGLLDDIIQEFAGGDKERIARITIELARDLQEMSGMTNKEKAMALSAKLQNHHDVAVDLVEKLKDSEGNPLKGADGKPIQIGRFIRKARIADDLSWICPYTGSSFQPVNLVFKTFDKDHIIPRTERLSDALESQVITSREVNAEKSKRTALQFIREMNLPKNKDKKQRFGIRTEAQYRTFVDALWPKSDPFVRQRAGGRRVTDDEVRCWRRKKFLLTEKWDGKDFTPADLTKTSHITKLAAQQVEAAFLSLPRCQRPSIIAITGGVTHAFRDKSWKLLPLLGEANLNVKAAHSAKLAADAKGEDFNFKKAVREITHLHHALDAITLGLIAQILVPAGHQSLNGDLARLIVKAKLNDEERREFETLRHQFGLPKFYQWAGNNTLLIAELPKPLKEQITERLNENRVVQHVPSEMTGLPAQLNAWRVERIEGSRVFLFQRMRQADNSRLANRKDVELTKVVGIQPETGNGKLKAVKGALILEKNYGAALEPEPTIIPFHKVWKRLQELKKANGWKMPRVLRSGQLITVPRGRYSGTWRVFSVKGTLTADLGAPDKIRLESKGPGTKREVQIKTLINDGMEIADKRLTGISACPSTSLA
jgi:CRISPR-associated endonuclease Csn1